MTRDHQGQLDGLLAAAEDTAAVRGCKELRLEVREDNARAIDLYEKSGYRATLTFNRPEVYNFPASPSRPAERIGPALDPLDLQLDLREEQPEIDDRRKPSRGGRVAHERHARIERVDRRLVPPWRGGVAGRAHEHRQSAMIVRADPQPARDPAQLQLLVLRVEIEIPIENARCGDCLSGKRLAGELLQLLGGYDVEATFQHWVGEEELPCALRYSTAHDHESRCRCRAKTRSCRSSARHRWRGSGRPCRGSTGRAHSGRSRGRVPGGGR